MANKIETQRDELARILEDDNIKIGQVNWSKLLKEGVIVSVHVHRWRSTVRLNWEDLGIFFDDKQEESLVGKDIKLGQQNLLPARYMNKLNSLESGVRQSLNRYSFDVYWGKFVPVKAYSVWKEEFENYHQTYMGIAQEILDNYDEIKKEVLDNVEKTYSILYSRLVALNQDLSLDSLSNLNREEFIENAVRKIEDNFRSRDYISSSFGLDYDLTYIPLLSDMTEDIERSKQLEMETQLIQDELSIKRQLIYEMEMDVIAKTEEKYNNMVEEILLPISKQIRGMVYDSTLDVLEAIRSKKSLNPRNVYQLKNMIEKVSVLEFQEDREVKAILTKLENSIIDIPSEDRDLSEIDQNLKDINTILKASLVTLGQEEIRSSRLLADIPSNPGEELVREARANLNLDKIIEINDMYRQQRFNLAEEQKIPEDLPEWLLTQN